MNKGLAYYADGDKFFQDGEKVYINRATEQVEPHLHAHNFIEIAYVARGKGSHLIGDREYEVNRGDLFLINYNVPHEFRSLSDQSKLIVYNCIFVPDFLDYSLENCKDFSELTHHFLFRSLFPEENEGQADIKLLEGESKDIEELYEKMYKEYNLKLAGYHDLLRAYLIELLINIFRLWQSSKKNVDEINIQRRQLIEKAISHMKDNYSADIRLKKLANIAILSPNYFSSIFKDYTGMNVTEYIQKLRIEEACRLLRKTNKKVIDIAGEIGYRDIKFFNKIFKKINGQTPSEYRNNH